MDIKEIRKLTGLSAQKFGDKYDIPLRTIQNWEGGVNTPPPYLVKLLDRVVKEDLEQEPKWIPVSERLPEIGDYALCSIADHYSKHKIIISQYNREHFWSSGIIKAWMPLPEPYKVESEDKR